ncbi:MAG TPA: plasmid stabilization protein [Parvibaculum sp.]|jgi:plasmid stability protein
MATLTIRNLDDRLKARLRVRAAEHGKSMEEEAREILRAGLASSVANASESLADIARRLFGPENGVDLQLPPRGSMREPPTFE